MTCAWQVEIDDWRRWVLEMHWPDVPKYGDVRNVGRHNLEPVDLIAGGFPCQPYSVAGKRRGAEDDRNLWPEFSRVIKEMQPRYVLAENVPGIITTYLDTVLSDLESQGYTCGTFNIPACAFGAPHRRYRIFVVAYSGSKRWLFDKPDFDSVSSKDVWRTHEQKPIRGSISGRLRLGPPPNVQRVDDGSEFGIHRLRALGDAVVPQVAEWIGRRIIEFSEGT